MSKEYRIPKNIKPQDLVRGIINASFWHWNTIDKTQHTEAITYLNNLEAIDNANPSEALECLEDIYRNGIFISDYDALGKQHPTNISPETNKSISEQCNTIKQALLKAQEQEKVLEFIKEKRIDLESFYTSFVEGVGDYSFYKRHYGTYGLELLAEEEFNLLKSVF